MYVEKVREQRHQPFLQKPGYEQIIYVSLVGIIEVEKIYSPFSFQNQIVVIDT